MSRKKHYKLNKKKQQRIAKYLFLAIISIALIFAIVFASTFAILNFKGKQNILPNISENTEYFDTIEYNGNTYRYNDDMLAIAFLGIDQNEMLSNNETDFVGANDADIVVAIDTETGETKMIAIPRDTMVEMDIYNGTEFVKEETNQLCLAYSYADGKELSCENATNSISRILQNVPIEKYYALNLQGISAINDSIGGVILKSQIDMPSYDVEKGKVVTLKGDMAESYVRYRSHYEVEGSLERTARQIQYLNSFAEQTVPAVFIDFSTVQKLYNVGAEYSQSNLTLSEVVYLATLLRQNNTTSFKSYILEGEMKSVEDSASDDAYKAEFYPDYDNLMQTIIDVFYLKIS